MTSIARFLGHRAAYYTRHRGGRPRSRAAADLLHTLRRDGVVVVPKFVPDDLAQRIADDLRSAPSPSTSDIDTRYASRVVPDFDQVSQTASEFFANQVLRDVAAAYVGPAAVPHRHLGRIDHEVGRTKLVDLYHFDEWRHKLKAMLYLNEVGPDQAPFVYLRGSHRFGLWRLPKEREYFDYYDLAADGNYTNEEADYCGHFFPPEVRRIKERHGLADLVCVGGPGTLVLFDSRGLHHSTPLRAGARYVASMMFVTR